MSPQTKNPAKRPVLIASCLMALAFVIALIGTATADAANYRMLLCAGNVGSNAFQTATNTTSAQNPSGIFSIENHCGPAPDPAGNGAYMRIAENQASGNAGYLAYGSASWSAPPWIAIIAAGGYTREPNAFNDGWRGHFWAEGFDGSTNNILLQGTNTANAGIEWAPTSTFAPHLWPFGGYGSYRRFVFDLTCYRQAGCDRTNFNAVDANTLVLTLADTYPSQVVFTGTDAPFLAGHWTRGVQPITFSWTELGSGIRFERVRIDGAERWSIDHIATGECNRDANGLRGEYAREFQACPTASNLGRVFSFDTAALPDGAHAVQACTQDYAQWQGLDGTGGESCDQRTVHTDNTAPGAPSGLTVTSANPARYLDHFGAQFSLPPNQGSPITKIHYSVIDAAGNVVVPEKVIAATNPTAIAGVEGPAQAGDYRLRVSLEDEVGFVGPAALAPIPRDTVPPAAPQAVSVTAPTTSRAAEGFDLRWRNIVDDGSPINSARYQVLDAAGTTVVPTTIVTGDNVQAVADLDSPSAAGSYQLRLWLTDAEGNVGAPVTAPLSYDCMRSLTPGGQQLTAAVGGQPSQTVAQGQGGALSGTLSGQGGPVATAPICVYSRVATDTGRDFLGIALTDPSGGYRFPIPSGPSRELSAVYRADQRQVRASATIATVVRPTLRARKTVVHNGESAYFEGEIPGPHNDDVTIVLQVKSGKGWLAFRRYRSRADGHYELTYPFHRTTQPTDYEMRAQVRESGGYPYVEGDSDPIVLHVVPGKARSVSAAPKAGRERCLKRIRPRHRGGAKHPCRSKHRGARHAHS